MERATRPPPTIARRETSPTFGELLRRFRIRAGITQEELAERADVSPRAIVNYERGVTRRPHRETVASIADALGLSTDERVQFVETLRTRPVQRPRLVPIPVPVVVPTLPIPLTPLIGRDADIAAVAGRMGEPGTRLLTITGPGGVGKTRLALAAAAALAGDCPDGVHFVSLASLTDPSLVLPAVAHAVGAREAAGVDLADALAATLRTKRVLLVLDNCEQVAAAAVGIVALLARCAHLRVVATSRFALRVRGEHVFPVSPLAIPTPQERDDLAALAGSPAVALFLDRARAIAPDFALTRANAAAVASICVTLDGLPLAIELAAARVRTLAPQELLARLDDRLSVLTRGARDLPERQRTLRDTLAWSHHLLSEDERRVIRRLAVFAGGWSPDAAGTVCADADIPAARVLDCIASLVGQSLVRSEPGRTDTARLGMYETVRLFVHAQLQASGERDRIERAHAAYHLALVEAAEPALTGPEQRAWLERLATEEDNVRAAAQWAAAHGETAFGLRLAAALWRFWLARGSLAEGRAWLERFIGAGVGDPSVPAPLLARATYGVGMLMTEQGEYAAAAALITAQIARLEAGAHEDQTSGLWNVLGNIARYRKDLGHAQTCYGHALRIFRVAGDRSGESVALNNLGIVARELGNHARATTLFEESLAVKRQLGNARGIGVALVNLADLARDRGEFAHAAERLTEAVTIFRDLADQPGLAYALNNFGEVAIGQGMADAAEAHLMESLRLFAARGDHASIAIVRRNLGAAAHAGGDAAVATTRYDEALRSFASLGNLLGVAECAEGLAIVAGSLRHEWARAVRLRSTAAALRRRLNTPLPPADRAAMDAAMDTARRALGADDFARAEAAGDRAAAEPDIARAIMGVDAAIDSGQPVSNGL